MLSQHIGTTVLSPFLAIKVTGTRRVVIPCAYRGGWRGTLPIPEILKGERIKRKKGGKGGGDWRYAYVSTTNSQVPYGRWNSLTLWLVRNHFPPKLVYGTSLTLFGVRIKSKDVPVA